MATNLKEYFRESMNKYLNKIKATYYTKITLDVKFDDIKGPTVPLDGYTTPGTGGVIGATDSVQVAIGKLDHFKTTKAQPNGVASLNAAGKVPIGQIPDSIIGGMIYQGAWNADTNSPDIAASSPDNGHYYIVSTDGSTDVDGETDWKAKDWVAYDGTTWHKIDNTQSTQIVHGVDIVGGFDDITQAQADADFDAA